MDKEKLAKLQAQVRIGGKGTPRRKQVKKSVTSTQGDDRKLQAALKKLGVQPITGVEEVNMFKEDGNVLHFNAPRVQAALPANTLAITGSGQTKELTELVPGILNQLGPDSLASLRRLAESYQSMTARQAAAAAAAGGAGAGAGEKKEGEVGDDDEIPDLVENFEEEGEKKAAADLEDLE
ncbi:nascent polypeptide-associated complex subunit beta [Kockovaella imperatae]|uniref:Nascent polypeptide-associated complex subunit beta n=1 Tax=Kockovaella imperatae TaxID=4999 RepID=A0A1Y1UG35_9TREE|nr:nascent polypeptide-associated complex subunit beta [Kockovaella imperatae]ORX36476.1 nascent polypeptide-associated complex subunit beta [Kockovaella imperatae]